MFIKVDFWKLTGLLVKRVKLNGQLFDSDFDSIFCVATLLDHATHHSELLSPGKWLKKKTPPPHDRWLYQQQRWHCHRRPYSSHSRPCESYCITQEHFRNKSPHSRTPSKRSSAFLSPVYCFPQASLARARPTSCRFFHGSPRVYWQLASIRDRLKVVEWLHVNRREGCTPGAMQRATVDGHFEVSLFLHANRTEGCAPNTIGDSDKCLWEIAQWLTQWSIWLIDVSQKERKHVGIHRWRHRRDSCARSTSKGRTLYKQLLCGASHVASLLLSTRQLETDLAAGRTLYNAIRSGATDSYPDARSDWQRERKFDSRFADMRAIQKWNRKRAFVTIVRSQFEIPIVDAHDTRALSQRIDAEIMYGRAYVCALYGRYAAFAALRDVDDHNALVRNLAARGAFQPKKRTDAVKFVVGDVVHVSDLGCGVVTGWTVARSHAFADLHVVYEILPHTGKHNRDAGRHHRVPQEDLELVETPKPVNNPSLLLYFDGFENGRHVPSAPLARRYPDDAAAAAAVGEDSGGTTADEQTAYTPSIMQLQFAGEDKLLQYLRCEDATVIQLATAALEGKWIGASTEEAQNSVREALRMMDMGEFKNARDSLLRVVEEVDPEYAYAWTKLGMAEFRAGDAETASRYYETALEKNPQLLDALVGLGTCATKLQRWSVAHSAAVRLMRLQPDNDVARILLENALLSTL